MKTEKEKYERLISSFLDLAKMINTQFDIEPLLYGSLGLQWLSGEVLDPGDIDVLAPDELLINHWHHLVGIMKSLGYELKDIKEREFEKEEVKIAFASYEDLQSFAGIELETIDTVEFNNTKFKLLNYHQYLEVYKKSILDGYRITNKNKEDHKKIEIIEKRLNFTFG